MRPFCDVGAADLLAPDRPHSVNALFGDGTGALHTVAREEDLSARIFDEVPYRSRVADRGGNLWVVDIVGVEIGVGDELVELAGARPVCVGRQNFNFRAFKVVENGRGIFRVVVNLDAAAVRVEFTYSRLNAGTVFCIAVS